MVCFVFNTENNIDILIGTESHLDNSISSAEIFPKTFNTYWNDRNIHGGGVFISVKTSIPSSHIDISPSCEIV